MSTLRANTITDSLGTGAPVFPNGIWVSSITDSAGGNTATINGITPALASQAEAEAGTDNTKLLTPLRAKQQMIANALGWGQTWQDVTASRTNSTSYQNTTGRPIAVSLRVNNTGTVLQVSADNTNWVNISNSGGSVSGTVAAIVPSSHYYRFNGTGNITSWAELR